MASLFKHDARGLALGELAASGVSPSRLEQYRLDRLRELRAVIETLRSEDTVAAPGGFHADPAHCLQL